MNAQFKKGVLNLCVLSMLKEKDMYGYELTAKISKTIDVSPGTLYLVLKRLRDDDLVDSYLKESDNGPARKYYTLTKEGHKEQEALENEWVSFSDAVNDIIRNEE